MLAAIEGAGETILRAGKAAGTIARDPEAYKPWRELGFQYLCTTLTSFISQAGRAYLERVREYEGSVGRALE